MNEIPDLLKTLHLKYVEPQRPIVKRHASQLNLRCLFEARGGLEVDDEDTAHQNRRKAARLPVSKTLDGFDFSFQSSLNERLVRESADLSFVRNHSNVVFLGPPELGKPISAQFGRVCAQCRLFRLF